MKNYVLLEEGKIELTAEQVASVRAILKKPRVRVGDLESGAVFCIGEHEMFVLEQSGDTTAVIRKELLNEEMEFGKNNCFDGSNVDDACSKFADEIAAIVGAGNLIEHTVDLTSDDGLKDYGKVMRRASLLTADLYRRYVDVLDRLNPERWWWLATPHSTERHNNATWVKCVSPSGRIYGDSFNIDFGVRPFCIFKSDIFVFQ